MTPPAAPDHDEQRPPIIFRSVTFQGASDDLVEVDGCPGADEFNTSRGVFRLISVEGEMLVAVAYDGASSGCWSVGFSPTEEGVPMPVWPLDYAEPINGYTAAFTVVCPPDVRLEQVR